MFFPWARALVITAVLSLITVGITPAAGDTGRALRIVFVTSHSGETQIAVVSSDATGYRFLTHGPGISQSPRWSPDGRRIVYASTRSGSWQIHVMNADGSRQRRISAPPGDHLFPVWSPDGRHILYVDQRGEDEQIHVMRADGSAARRLTGRPGRNTVPVWSPDGTTIAFVSTRDGVPELYVMRADGAGQHRLTAPDTYVRNAYSRGGQRLAPAGILLRPGSLHPAWSPDGQHIAFAVRVGRAEQQVSIVDVRTGAARRLTTGYAPDWSPDGTRLAFVVARVGDSQIYVANADGAGVRRLTEAGSNMLPAWSPDGRWIAFLAADRGGLGVYVMRPDGSAKRRLADAAGDLSMLPVIDWQPR